MTIRAKLRKLEPAWRGYRVNDEQRESETEMEPDASYGFKPARGMKRLLVPALVVPMLLVVLTSSTFAAEKYGCPTGWDEMTLDETAAYIWPRLLAQDAFPGGETELRDVLLAPINKNGDDSICLKVKTFTNPNSHWYKVGIEILGSPTEFMNPIDNNANASNA